MTSGRRRALPSFRLKVNNYQFPKVKIDPLNAHITTANTRQYAALSYAQLYQYFRSFWLGRTGQGRKTFQARTDALKRTLYSGALVFSGNEEQGYLVFPVLDDDVRSDPSTHREHRLALRLCRRPP